MGVIKYFSSLIELLSIPCRVSYVPVLRDILLAASPFNWRLRQMIASQFKDLVTMLPIQNLYATLFPLAITLIQDRIAEVRYSILPGITKMMLVVLPGYQPSYLLEEFASDGTVVRVQPPPISEDDITFLEAIVLAINALIVSDAYIYRQIWCELAVELLIELPSPIFEKYFMDGILQLTGDPITNVRVKVAELLTKWEKYGYPKPWEDREETRLNPWKWLLAQEQVHRCVERLSQDDRDVYLCLQKIQPLFPSLELVEISCRGLKTAPSGISLTPAEPPIEMAGVVELSNLEEGASLVADRLVVAQEMETEDTMTPSPPATNETKVDSIDLTADGAVPATVPEVESEPTKSENEQHQQEHESSVPPSPSNGQEAEGAEGDDNIDQNGNVEKTDNTSLTLTLPPPPGGHENGESGEVERSIVTAQLSDLISNLETNSPL